MPTTGRRNRSLHGECFHNGPPRLTTWRVGSNLRQRQLATETPSHLRDVQQNSRPTRKNPVSSPSQNSSPQQLEGSKSEDAQTGGTCMVALRKRAARGFLRCAVSWEVWTSQKASSACPSITSPTQDGWMGPERRRGANSDDEGVGRRSDDEPPGAKQGR